MGVDKTFSAFYLHSMTSNQFRVVSWLLGQSGAPMRQPCKSQIRIQNAASVDKSWSSPLFGFKRRLWTQSYEVHAELYALMKCIPQTIDNTRSYIKLTFYTNYTNNCMCLFEFFFMSLFIFNQHSTIVNTINKSNIFCVRISNVQSSWEFYTNMGLNIVSQLFAKHTRVN